MERLLEIMARLRDPQNGCPWDLEQTFATIVPHTIEEAYEVADAIEREDYPDLCDELGDLLFQVAFYAQMAKEQELFDFSQIVDAICDKMIRRHPHVFADARIDNADHQTEAWEQQKAAERQAKSGDKVAGQLDGVAKGLPALKRAEKLQKRAAKVGFDWSDSPAVLAKVHEELDELQQATMEAESQVRVTEELGDLLFSCVNLARHMGVDAEAALRQANGRFEHRFAQIERRLHEQGSSVEEADLAEMDRLWNEVKRDAV
ncbi:MAG: nucleoside triphosphate pyrophosphohydrolase [Chromatiales bacterium]|nr:nucleoside triphosphate pyrophosphohydrolase [Chromatiales bacterium]